MQDVPLTVTLEYVYSSTASQTQLALLLPSGFTDYDGNPTATAFISGSVSPATIEQVTFYLNIGADASLGEYSFPLDLNWTISLSPTVTLNLFQQTSATVYLKGAPNLKFEAQQESLVAGEVNQIALTLENTGSGTASDISTSVSAQGGTVLQQPAEVAVLDAGSNVSQEVSLYVPSSAASSALVLTFTSDYVDPYNNTGTSTFSLGLLVSSSSETNGVQLLFTTQQQALTPGSVNRLTVTVTNEGTNPAHDLVTTVSASDGATILTQPSTVASLKAGGNATLSLSMFVPTSSAGSAVTLTFSSTYLDIANNQDSATSSLGLLVASASANGVELSFTTSQQTLGPNAVTKVVLTVANTGTTAARQLTTSASTSGGATVVAQPSEIAELGPHANASVSLSVFVPTSDAGSAIILTLSSTYIDVDNNTDSSTSSIGFLVPSTSTSTEPLSLTATGNSIIAGDTSTVSFLIKNAGDAPIFSPVVSFSASSPLVIVANSSESYSGLELNPGATLRYEVVLSSSPSTTGGAYAGSLSIDYQAASGTSESETLSVGITIADQQAQISVKAVDTTLYVGQSSKVDFVITNTGNVPLYSPSFSLSAPSSISVLENSTFAKSGMILNPGQSFTYETTLSSGPSTSEGAYSGTVTVSYSDQFGNPHSLSSSVGFLLIGSIDLVVQSESTSQSGSTITVSGTLLNEGQASAYYVTLVANATIDGRPVGGGSDYVGEVEPDTPVAFSITVTFTGFAARTSTQTATPTATMPSVNSTSASSTSISSSASPSSSSSSSSSSSTFTFPGNLTGSFTRTGSFSFSRTSTQSVSSTSDPPNSTSTSTTTTTSSVSPPTIVAVKLSGSYENDYGLSYSYSGPSKSLVLATSSVSTTSSSSSSSSQSQTLEYARIVLVVAVAAAIAGSVFYVRRARRLNPAHEAPGAKEEPVI